jgi:hypothetical protein
VKIDNKYLMLTALLFSSVLFAADNGEPIRRAAKATEYGMELFSWHVKGDDAWHFALLPAAGIDKLKSAETVAAKENDLDLAALKKKLAGLAMGEKVGWFNMLEKDHAPPENLVFDLPPREIVKELELYCTVQKVRLNIYRGAPKKP